jgi:hypothetical protein
MNQLPETVQRTYDVIVRELGTAFSFQALIREISLRRGKRLVIDQAPMPVSMTGYCIGLQDVDLITTREGLDSFLAEMVRLHECAHLLLSHIPKLSAGPETPTYAEFCERRNSQNAIFRAHTNIYDDPDERDAETLATMLYVAISEYKKSLPSGARDLHG